MIELITLDRRSTMKVLDKFLDAIRLNDDYDDDDEFYDDDYEEEDEAKQKKRFFKKLEDDYDDDYDFSDKNSFQTKKTASASKSAAKPTKSSSKITPMRKRTGSSSMEVCIIKPSSMEDTREIADTLISHCTVILNLEGIDVDVAQRIIDFSSGSCYSIGGSLQKVSSYIFILTPENVEVSGDFQEILSDAFDMPSIRSEF